MLSVEEKVRCGGEGILVLADATLETLDYIKKVVIKCSEE